MARRRSVLKDVLALLREHRAYWLTPIVVVLLLLGALVYAGSTSAGPFIYTVF
ncbi:MAG: hypothetical protein KA978_13615 [Deltaproteobacteria bacterium]|jgi:hypothetical protein|nr:hypothetical protein [Deltaproteobacteria bacterium]